MCSIVRLKLIFLTFIFLIPLKILATTEKDFCPYIGADIQIRKMPFKKGFGDDLFKQESVQGNFYVGFKVNKNFGFEIGHQVADKKDSNTLTSTEPRLGRVESFGVGLKETGTRQIKGWNLNLVGFLPVSTEYKTSLIGMVGLSSLELRLKDVVVRPGVFVNAQREVKFKQRKNVLRLGGGVQKMFSESFGIRATLVWENTSRFNNISQQNSLGETYTAKLKDSWTYGIGAFIMF